MLSDIFVVELRDVKTNPKSDEVVNFILSFADFKTFVAIELFSCVLV